MALPNAWPQQATVSRIAPRRRELEAATLSQRWWGLDWRDVLPFHFDDGRAEFATMGDVLPFISEHYPAIFGAKDVEGRFLQNPMTEAKRRFFAEMDFFLFRVAGDVAGVFMAHPWDWSTYYLRSTGILPQYREQRLMTHFFDCLDEPLRAAGVERIEAEVSPANAPIIRVLAGHGYIVTGQVATERWGLLLRYTKFLSQGANAVFGRQYTAMRIAKRRETPKTGACHEEVRPSHCVSGAESEV
ncbi:MAG TPA: GNAT family N-acetyltransferase [Polyangiaceae bacterium]